jgi:hypothetical protein
MGVLSQRIFSHPHTLQLREAKPRSWTISLPPLPALPAAAKPLPPALFGLLQREPSVVVLARSFCADVTAALAITASCPPAVSGVRNYELSLHLQMHADGRLLPSGEITGTVDCLRGSYVPKAAARARSAPARVESEDKIKLEGGPSKAVHIIATNLAMGLNALADMGAFELETGA